MNTRLWREALDYVDALLQRPDTERTRALGELARSHPHLHPLVASLLQADRDASNAGFMESGTPRAESRALQTGATLGPYRIVSQLGAGGMGEVWLAQRIDGLYESDVAIKTLHPYFAGGALRARFLREANLLGRLTHPRIARLLDAGVANDGVVYLVLEYVKGVALDVWCNSRKLSIEQRLGLFLDVCAAVSHAHSHLIVHRDLKPSNILVTDSGDVKLLDFGVAMLLDTGPPAASDLTRLTGRVFTPEYAAPEQMRGEAITTATDVYSLGVLLYVLLCGKHPHSVAVSKGMEHLERSVLNDEPPRVSRMAPTPRLQRELAGDLDNIVAHALEKQPQDRYPSVLAFAEDVKRHLNNEPVDARTASFTYRASKFFRRHRVGVSVGALATSAAVAGVVAILWQSQIAQSEAQKATAIRDFLVGVFERNSVAHPDGARARKTTAEELLAESARQIRGGLRDAPEVRDELLGVMSQLYSTLDMQKEAIPLLQERLAAQKATHGEASLPVAKTLTHLSFSQIQIGEYVQAQKTAQEALRIFTQLGDESSLEHATLFGNLGQAAYRIGSGEVGEVRRHFEAGLKLIEKHHPRNKWRIEMLLGLSRAANLEGDFAGSLQYTQRALDLFKANAVDADGIVLGSVYQVHGSWQHWMNMYPEAERNIRQAIVEYEKAGGPDHPFTSDGRRELGMFLSWTGKRGEAKEHLSSALATQERVKGPDDPELVAYIRTQLANTLILRGELAAAEPQLTRAIDAWIKSSTRALPHGYLSLGRLRTQQGRFEDAERVMDGIEARVTELFGDGSWAHGTMLARLGELRLAQGRVDEAQQYFERLWTKYPEAPDKLMTNRAAAAVGLIRIDFAATDYAAVERRARELIAAIEASRGRSEMPDEEAAAHMLLGAALLQKGDKAQAREHLERAVTMRERMDAPESLWLAEARLHLARFRHAIGDRARARALLDLATQAHQAHAHVGPQFRTFLQQTRAVLAR
jgi:eukaryotic-like serine/threonine-protein kinase